MKLDTLLVHAGRDPERFEGLVNAPVTRASTILHPDMATFNAAASNKHGVPYYGRYGTSISKLLAEACAELDGAAGAVLFPSGLAAIAGTLAALLKPGGHLLMVDSVYAPVRELCEKVLQPQGVAVTFYPPHAGAGIADLLRPETQVVYCEAPGSHTFEMQDVPAIGKVAAARGIPVVIDNTWATSYYFKPLQHGADIAIQAATKYLVGHSDAMLGVATCTETWLPVLQRSTALQGNRSAPTTATWRCAACARSRRGCASTTQGAMKVATGCKAGRRSPACSTRRSRKAWSARSGSATSPAPRACSASSSIPRASRTIDAFVDGLQLFGIGVSWGGYESLVLPSHVRRSLSAASAGPLVRFHIGLEDPDDLIADLAAGLRTDACR